MSTALLEAPIKPPKASRSRFGLAYRIVLAMALVAVLAEAARVMALTNRHTVLPGKLYRSSQPSGAHVRELAAQHGIKTVLNLRGLSNEFDWYKQECEASAALGLSQEDITLSANSLPPPAEVRRIVEVLDRAEYPILIHCKAGADRTGLVSAVALLLMTDARPGEARKQLLPRFGHFRFGRTAAMDEFFDQYDNFLAARGEEHSRDGFRRWLLDDYCPGPARARLEWAEPPPATVKAGTSFALKMTATNTSIEPWHLSPGTFAGIHASYQVAGADGKNVYDNWSGFRTETVFPGRATEFLLPVGGLPRGDYHLLVELHDSTGAGIPFRTNSFGKFGGEPLVARFAVE